MIALPRRLSVLALATTPIIASQWARAEPHAGEPAAATALPLGPNRGPTDGKAAAAEERFHEGSEAFDHGRLDAACSAFADSLRLYPTLGTLLNLALCHERQGKTASAWAEFTQAAAWANDPSQRDRRDFAHQHSARLERSLLRVRLEIDGDDRAVAVSIDGERVPTARRAMPVFLDPGEHEIAATAPDHEDFTTKVTVVAGAPDGLVVRIPLLEPRPPVTAPSVGIVRPAARRRDVRRVLAWLAGGVGVSAVGVGLAFAFDAISKTDSLGSTCSVRCSSGPAQASEVISMIGFGVGAASLVAGAWLLFSPAPQASMSVRLSLAPSVDGRGGGFDLAGTF
ncbi:MAG: hypothetical protein ABSC94_17145 [Polyangiaceae bacterium]|jgi:hypothetical protein